MHRVFGRQRRRLESGVAGLLFLGALVLAPGQAQATSMSYCDDCSTTVSLPFSFPFCGTNWTSVALSSNGQMTFGGQNNDWSPTTAEFLQSPARIGMPWNDTQVLYGGAEEYFVYPDHMEMVFSNVPNYWTGGFNTYSVTIWDTGAITIDINMHSDMHAWNGCERIRGWLHHHSPIRASPRFSFP